MLTKVLFCLPVGSDDVTGGGKYLWNFDKCPFCPGNVEDTAEKCYVKVDI